MPEVSLGITAPFGHGRVLPSIPAVADPAVGGGLTIAATGGYWLRPISLAFRLVSDGNAGNRQVTLSLLDESSTLLNAVIANGTQAASLTRDYVFATNLTTAATVSNGIFLASLFSCFIRPGWSLVVSVGTVQVGDQISNVRWLCDQFITGAGGYELGTTFQESDALHRTQVYADELA